MASLKESLSKGITTINVKTNSFNPWLVRAMKRK